MEKNEELIKKAAERYIKPYRIEDNEITLDDVHSAFTQGVAWAYAQIDKAIEDAIDKDIPITQEMRLAYYQGRKHGK